LEIELQWAKDTTSDSRESFFYVTVSLPQTKSSVFLPDDFYTHIIGTK